MDEPLPSFRYHPDPLSTGSFKPDADTPCLSCNRLRGYIYTGSVWTEKNFILDDHLCPWCIADGSAARRFGATFNYTGTLDDVSDAVREEIEMRTPGFIAWQQEVWLGCCGDGAAFLGLTGAKELREQFADAAASVKRVLREDYHLAGAELEDFLNSLSTEADPTAYIFRCLHCGKYLSYVDQA
jgi:uncharacterized protein CbrC (UPF0167 family)